MRDYHVIELAGDSPIVQVCGDAFNDLLPVLRYFGPCIVQNGRAVWPYDKVAFPLLYVNVVDLEPVLILRSIDVNRERSG